MRRFLLLAIPLLVLTMALFHFVQEMAGTAPDAVRLARGAGITLPGWVMLGTWCLEAMGLTALFLLIYRRESPEGRGGWLAGILTGWIAWVFRGPLLVVAAVGLGGLPAGPWWSLAFSWWILYTVCGVVLAGLSGLLP
ncbi:MAG TPA: hypothetical protein VHU81_02925 [Thermoanaerobaculia bacterium]|nr:hypothetical protein [Thermoanaerobaculia bacterium]